MFYSIIFLIAEHDVFLLYSSVTSIESLHLLGGGNANTPKAPIQNDKMRNVIGMALDYENKQIFYSDIMRGSIYSVDFQGQNLTLIVDCK